MEILLIILIIASALLDVWFIRKHRRWQSYAESNISTLASSITTMQSIISIQAGQITTLQQSVASIETYVMAKWDLDVDPNGYVKGVKVSNNGHDMEFRLKADQFRVLEDGEEIVISSNPEEIMAEGTPISDLKPSE